MEEATKLLAQLKKFIAKDETKTPLLTGRIVKILPFVRKSQYQMRNVQVIHVTDVFPAREIDGSHMKLIFSDKAAETVFKLSLKEGDRVAVTNVLLINNSDYNSDPVFLPVIAHIGSTAPCNVMKHVFYRRGNTTMWINAERNCWIVVVGHCEDKRKITVPKWMSTAFNARVFLHRCDELYESVYVRPRLTKLIDVGRSDILVNVLCVVVNIIEEPKLTSGGWYRTIFNIVDETRTKAKDAVQVWLYFSTKQENPHIDLHSILFINRARFNMKQTKVYSKIKIEQVTTFDRRYVQLFRTQNQEFKLTSEIKESFVYLRDWLSTNAKKLNQEWLSLLDESKPSFPVFYLKNLNLKSQKMTITGVIREKKLYADRAILRVSDGTKCAVPTVRYAIESNYWISAVSNIHCILSSSEIDIAIISLESRLMSTLHRLSVGERVKLHDVDLKVCTLQMNGNWLRSLKASLEGTVKNVQILDGDLGNQRGKDQNIMHKEGVKRSLCWISQEPFFLEDTEDNTVENEIVTATAETNCLINQKFDVSKKPCPMSKKELISIPNEDVQQAATQDKMNAITTITQTTAKTADNIATAKELPRSCFESGRVPLKQKACPKSERVAVKRRRNGEPSKDLSSILSIINHNQQCTIANNNARLQLPLTQTATPREKNSRLQTTDNAIVRCNQIEAMYFCRWPQAPEVDKSFRMKVYLVSTVPSIDVNGGHSNMLEVLKGYCSKCDSFCLRSAVIWTFKLNQLSSFICPNCYEKGQVAVLDWVFSCCFLLMDEMRQIKNTVVMGRYAEAIFGCTASELNNDSECQRKVMEFGQRYLSPGVSQNLPLKCTLVPIRNNRDEVDLHIVHLSQF